MRKKKGGEPTCERIRFLREAAVVTQNHTLGCPDPEQTVGLHAHNALNLLLVLHPEPSLDLIKAVQWHDATQRYTGDLADPAKWGSSMLSVALSQIENKIHDYFGTNVELSVNDALWLHSVDKLDILLTAQERRALGDYRFTAVVAACSGWFAKRPVPAQVARFLDSYVHGTRLLDVIPGETHIS